MHTDHTHTLIIGAGAAGMLAAAHISQQGKSVALIDHAEKIGEKIRISGGGRCNFTNLNLNQGDPSTYYISQSPRFVRHAIGRYRPNDFLKLIEAYGIAYHEKHKGQLFCNHSAQDIIAMLQQECVKGKVAWHRATRIERVVPISQAPYRFAVHTANACFLCENLIIATGGLAAPAIGATPLGYQIAVQFGHTIIAPQAALVPLRFADWTAYQSLAGITLPVAISVKAGKQTICFHEDLLFRHKGLSGPAILQISSYWQAGKPITINLAPEINLATALCQQAHSQKIQLNTALKALAPHLPDRLIQHWLSIEPFAAYAQHKWADIPHRLLQTLGNSLNQWQLIPSGSDGHKKAEATRGGVDVAEIDSKTMQSRLYSGLYFIGEVMDIVGWLGGYNFHWAWASAVCCAQAINENTS